MFVYLSESKSSSHQITTLNPSTFVSAQWPDLVSLDLCYNHIDDMDAMLNVRLLWPVTIAFLLSKNLPLSSFLNWVHQCCSRNVCDAECQVVMRELFVCVSVCLCVCLCVCVYVYLSICMSVYLCVRLAHQFEFEFAIHSSTHCAEFLCALTFFVVSDYRFVDSFTHPQVLSQLSGLKSLVCFGNPIYLLAGYGGVLYECFEWVHERIWVCMWR
jgi:hypothetical protein